MDTKNKKNVASEALIDMDNIVSMVKEASDKKLDNMLSEAVRKALRESCEDGKCEEEKDENLEAADNKEMETEKDSEEQSEEPVSEPTGEEEVSGEEADASEAPEEGEGENEWDEYSEYKVGDDNSYDLTGENDYEKVVKVFKLLRPDEEVVVKNEDNKIQLKDNSTDTEYVIDLGGDESEEPLEMNEDTTPAGFPEEEETFELDDKMFESKKTRKVMKENKAKQEVLFEVDLGYTDNYQDKDVISGLSNEEPAKNANSWDKGIPTGTAKPWAGPSKDKGQPFEGKVDECGMAEAPELAEEDTPEIGAEEPMEEGVHTSSTQATRKENKQAVSQVRKDYLPQKAKNISTAADGYQAELNESKAVLAMKKENKELKEAIVALRKNLNEAYITNVNLGKITKLFLENATSREEKVNIVNRFSNEAKTVEQSNKLFESIDKELKKKKESLNINESSVTAKGTKELNESKVYQSQDLLKTLDLMKRINNMNN